MDNQVMWYLWADQTAFDAWHSTVCAQLHLPRPGENEGSGIIDTSAQWTTAYTAITEVAANDWRAVVEDAIASAYPAGLGAPSDPPPTPAPFY